MNIQEALDDFDTRMTAYSTYAETTILLKPTRKDTTILFVYGEDCLQLRIEFISGEECIAWLLNPDNETKVFE